METKSFNNVNLLRATLYGTLPEALRFGNGDGRLTKNREQEFEIQGYNRPSRRHRKQLRASLFQGQKCCSWLSYLLYFWCTIVEGLRKGNSTK